MNGAVMKVLGGMSGGGDSSVAAWLLREQGYEVVGATFKLWGEETESSKCCSADDIGDARYVCHQLGIPHYVFNYTEIFLDRIVEPFAAEYARGRTPNPCILCNRYIKLDEFCRRARELGFDYVATGHYARVERDADTGRWELLRGRFPEKDQSYVLYTLTQEQLGMFLLPVGEYPKTEIRRIAEEQGLVVARKPDSQDICFVPDGDYGAFLRRYTGKELIPGSFVDKEGKVLGPHKGLQCYTVGQRKGLGIALGKTMYVSAIDPEAGTVTLVEDEAELFGRRVTAEDLNFVAIPGLEGPIRAEAKLRYSHRQAPALLTPLEDGGVEILFDQPQRAATPGQAVVFYDGERVLGGGTIR